MALKGDCNANGVLVEKTYLYEMKNGTSIGVMKQAGKINIWNLKSDVEWSSTTVAVGYEKVCVVSNLIL